MREQDFTRYLKQFGKKPHVIDGLIRQVERFESFLATRGKEIDAAGPQDIQDYVAYLESQASGSARVNVRGIGLYFKFLGQPTLAAAAFEVREQAINKTRQSFKLAEFRGIDLDHISCLKGVGIQNVEQMLAAGSSPQLRQQLAEQTGVPVAAILELVKLSDLSRLSGVKAIRARLYYDAGADTVEKIASFDPDQLLSLTMEFVQRTHFDGIAPLPKEVRSTIETARKLPKIVVI
jgi:hypothetical protein